jgi:hypothetical protein
MLRETWFHVKATREAWDNYRKAWVGLCDRCAGRAVNGELPDIDEATYELRCERLCAFRQPFPFGRRALHTLCHTIDLRS